MSSRPPLSPTSSSQQAPSPGHSRSSSIRSQSGQQHAPLTPSSLREAYTLSASPERRRSDHGDASGSECSPGTTPGPVPEGEIEPIHDTMGRSGEDNGEQSDNHGKDVEVKVSRAGTSLLGRLGAGAEETVRETTSLLRRPIEFVTGQAHPGPCNHGTFSPQPGSRTVSIRSSDGNRSGQNRSEPRGLFGSIADGLVGAASNGKKKMSTTARLAEEHGIETSSIMYFTYYIPFIAWIRQYKWSYLHGDFIAAVTMASFYIPMALSYASNLGHVPPINGLYSFVFNPLIYALLGSCPQLVVGPEAAGSLLLGSVVRDSVDSGKTGDDDDEMHARVAGLVTGMAGAVIFCAGLARLGFLDSVLSRPFMRGFISSVGVIIIVDQLITELGLAKIAQHVGGVSHGSSIDKLRFIFQHLGDTHRLTFIVAGVSFAIIMGFREIKRRMQPRYPMVAYIPDRFLVVVLSAVLAGTFRWDKEGLEVLGEVKSVSGANPFPFHFPFQIAHMKHVRQAMGTSFLIALLGFFESSVAAKALGGGEGTVDGIQNIQLSPNRELVALGVANLVGGCFMALPAFGGYGRSKVNASTGGKTPMSSIFLSLITIICILYLLPSFYYLPKAVLSSMITVVAWSLVEEAPHDISFFIRIRGYTELGLMLIIFCATIFYSLSLGIAIGVGLSLLSVIRHSTRPRIQILGRIPGTTRFENAEDNPAKLEFIEGCLIVKIPEPLTFANTGDLKNRLRRLELYGTTTAHPALPRVRHPDLNRNIIFDIHGVTSLDGSGTQVLVEIVHNYRQRGVRVFFTRGPAEGTLLWGLFVRSGILDEVGGPSHFVADVNDALRLTEVEAGGYDGYENFSGDEAGG